MKNLKQTFILIFSLALWFGVVGGVGLARKYIEGEFADKTDEIDINDADYNLMKCVSNSYLLEGFIISSDSDTCYVKGGKAGGYSYNMKKLRDRFVDLSDKIKFSLLNDMQVFCLEYHQGPKGGSMIGNIEGYCYVKGLENEAYKYNLNDFLDSCKDKSEEIDFTSLNSDQLRCDDRYTRVGPLGGRIYKRIDEYCYVSDSENGSYKYNLNNFFDLCEDITDNLEYDTLHSWEVHCLKGYKGLKGGRPCYILGDYCCVDDFSGGCYKYNVKRISDSYKDITNEINYTKLNHQQAHCDISHGPNGGNIHYRFNDYCHVIDKENGNYKYSISKFFDLCVDVTSEIDYPQLNEMQYKCFFGIGLNGGFIVEKNGDYCYVVDENNGNYKYKIYKTGKVMDRHREQVFSFSNSSKINFTNNLVNFGSTPNVEVEYDYNNQGPSVEKIDLLIQKEVIVPPIANISNNQKACQLNYELLGDWQFRAGESNTPPYVWVNSQEELETKKNKLEDYKESRVYKYKYICHKQGDLKIGAPSYINYEISNNTKNQSQINLSSSSKNQKKAVINLEQKATCQMFYYYPGLENFKKEDLNNKDIFYRTFDHKTNLLDLWYWNEDNPNQQIQLRYGVSDPVRIGINSTYPEPRTFTNKVQFNISQLNGCQPVETIENPTKEVKDEPLKQEDEYLQTNPTTTDPEYNPSTPQLKFLENNKDISIDDFNKISSFIYGYDEDGLVALKYQWSNSSNKDYTFLNICSNKSKLNNGNSVAFLKNTKSVLTSAQAQKPKTPGEYYLYVCLKDKGSNIASDVAYYNIINNDNSNNKNLDDDDTDQENYKTNKVSNCADSQITWCDSNQGPVQGSINPCCQETNLVECKNNNNSYQIETIEANSNQCQ
jgi:hypothetical protein